MAATTELLNFIYSNSQMGVITIEKLIKIVKDETFKQHLEAQFNEYKTFNDQARQGLNERGYDEKGIGTLSKLRTYLMIDMQTLRDASASHVAEMLIIGSNMGILNAVKNLKKYKEADPDVIELMNKLLQFEEINVQRLKDFL